MWQGPAFGEIVLPLGIPALKVLPRYAVGLWPSDNPPMRIGCLSHTQKSSDRPQRYVSKNAANALLRRLLAVRLTKNLIQMVDVQQMGKALPDSPVKRPRGYAQLQHHLEPKLEPLTLGNSPWLQFLHGYR